MLAIVYGYNELYFLKESVARLKENIDEEDLIIAVDNSSTDGTREWLQEQTDIDFVYFDDGVHTFSGMMNEILAEYNCYEDILFLQASHFACKQSISRMVKVFEENEYIGLLSPITNDKSRLYDFCEAKEYSDINRISEMLDEVGQVIYSLGVQSGVFLVRKQVVEKIGAFDEKIMTIEKAIEDYALRSIMEGYLAGFCDNALFFHAMNEGQEDPFQVYYEKDMAYMRQKWDMQYFNKYANHDLISLIPEDRDKEISVLEVGCDCGATLIAIKNKYVKAHVHGIEINPIAARIASRYFDVKVRNIEEIELRQDYAVNSFDYIIFGDVLEHLREPEKVVMHCRDLLKEGGCILTSIPNLMHASVLRNLINGYFTYTEMGLLDKTHIHMFTYYEIMRMFSACDYYIERTDCVKIALSMEESAFIDDMMKISEVPDRVMFETFQYVIKAKAQHNRIYAEAPDKILQSRLETIANNPYKGEIHLWKYLIEVVGTGVNFLQIENKNVLCNLGIFNDSFPEASEEAIRENELMVEGLTEREILFALAPIRRCHEGIFRQTALDDYIDTIEEDRYLVLEPQTTIPDELIHTKNRCVFNGLAITTKYGIEDSDTNEVLAYIMQNLIYPLQDIFKAPIPESLSINAFLNANMIVKERRAYIAFFSEVLNRIKPKVIVYTHGPIFWICYLNEAAKSKGIPTVEIAHGAGELSFIYPKELKYADYYLVHSVLESDIMKSKGHVNVTAIGKPRVYFDCRESRRADGTIVIGFVSSVEAEFLDIAMRMAERLPKERYKIVYKVHTSENVSKKEEAKAQKAGVVFANGGVDMREFLKCSDVIVGIRSSALIDALPFEYVKIIMLEDVDREGVNGTKEFVKKLVQAGEIIQVEYEEELYREILSYQKGKKYRAIPNLYWPIESDHLFKNFIDKICKNK